MTEALTTPRLRLEPIVASHADEMFGVLAPPAIYTWLDYGPPASVEQLRALYTRLEARRSGDGREIWLNWVARLHAGGAAIGYLQSTVVPGEEAWVAYVLTPSFWGRGLATEAMQAVLAHLAQAHPVPRVLAVVEAANLRSAALLQRLGFTPADAAPGQALTASERLYQRAGFSRPPPR